MPIDTARSRPARANIAGQARSRPGATRPGGLDETPRVAQQDEYAPPFTLFCLEMKRR